MHDTPLAARPLLEHDLAQALLAARLLPEEALRRAQDAARASGATLLHSLTELGLIEEEALARFVAGWLGCPFLAEAELPDAPGLGEALGPAWARRARVMVAADEPDGVLLAMADPLDDAAYELVAFHLERRVRRAVATAAAIDAALRRRHDGHAVAAAPAGETGFASDEDIARLTALANEGPVIRLVSRILATALEAGASDVHIEPHEGAVAVRYRIDGRLREVERLPPQQFRAVASRIKIMARLDIAERRLPQDGRTRINVRGREVDCRVSTTPILHGESLVVRLLDNRQVAGSLEQLGFEPAVRARLEAILRQPHGMVLVTGPTGSGKTTTLYAALRRLSAPERKLFTVEDPIEYQLPGVCQVQVHPAIDLTFAGCLRAILRQDPDIVMIGEIRDAETAAIAVRAALTGHLVLSTLHTNSAASAITRLADMGVDRFLLAPTLKGILAQRLVRKPCRQCAGRDAEPDGGTAGCPACAGSGYAGRTAVVELLTVTEAVQAAILAGAAEDAIERAAGNGFISLLDDGLAKVARGETTRDELAAVVHGLG